MPPPVDGLPTGRPRGPSAAPSRPDRLRPARRPQHAGPTRSFERPRTRLISFMDQQQKRDGLYAKSREELKERFQFGRMGGVA